MVSTKPGAIAFAVTPNLPSSSATVLAKPIEAGLAAASVAWASLPSAEVEEDLPTMRPHLASRHVS